MRVYLQYELNESGKGKFLRRLIPELEKIGVSVGFSEKGADICLGISKWRDKIPDMPRILRIDGIYLDGGKKEDWRNEEIRKSIKKAHGVIFQSKWCAKEVSRVLKVEPKMQFVIHNGAPLRIIKERHTLSKKYNVLFVSSWGGKKERKNKRLKWHLGVAEKMIDRTDIQFWLIGQTPYKIVPTKNLGVVGMVGDDELVRWYNAADLLVFLSTPDWCPNTVVECICCGTPVLCMAGCGVEEIVEPGGGWAQARLDLIPQNIGQMLETYKNAYREDLLIENVAVEYKKAFEEVCK